jgi:probable DNA metabolism protein
MKGLIRFQELSDGVWYAPIAPEHNILPLVGRHFKLRLCNQQWMIHDTVRGTALICDGARYDMVTITEVQSLRRSPEEEAMRALWQTYFTHIAIQQRRNVRLQRQHMPRRYWRHLTEMEQFHALS